MTNGTDYKVEMEKTEKELKTIESKYKVVDARTKQQYKNLIDKIENRQKMPNASYKGVSLTDIMKDAIKEVEIPEGDKTKMVELKKKINAYKTLMG